MTKYFKLLGIALLATSMAFVSCGDEGENNDPINDPQPPVEEVTPGAKVTFGSTSWDALGTAGLYYANPGAVAVDAYSDANGEQYPMFMSAIMATAAGTYTDAVTEELSYANQTIAWLEYWEATYWTLSGSNYGDWWTKEATINVTELDLTAMTVSMNVNATMFLFEDIVVMNEDGTGGSIDPTLLSGATTESMTVVATKVPMQSAKGGLKK